MASQASSVRWTQEQREKAIKLVQSIRKSIGGDEIGKMAYAAEELACQRNQLLEALKGVTERLVGLIDCGDCGFWESAGEETVIAARAAIAKADSNA